MDVPRRAGVVGRISRINFFQCVVPERLVVVRFVYSGIGVERAGIDNDLRSGSAVNHAN